MRPMLPDQFIGAEMQSAERIQSIRPSPWLRPCDGRAGFAPTSVVFLLA